MHHHSIHQFSYSGMRAMLPQANLERISAVCGRGWGQRGKRTLWTVWGLPNKLELPHVPNHLHFETICDHSGFDNDADVEICSDPRPVHVYDVCDRASVGFSAFRFDFCQPTRVNQWVYGAFCSLPALLLHALGLGYPTSHGGWLVHRFYHLLQHRVQHFSSVLPSFQDRNSSNQVPLCKETEDQWCWAEETSSYKRQRICP